MDSLTSRVHSHQAKSSKMLSFSLCNYLFFQLHLDLMSAQQVCQIYKERFFFKPVYLNLIVV